MEGQTKAKFDELRELQREIAGLQTAQLAPLKLLRGWKPIGHALGLDCSPQTVRRLARKYKIPIVYMAHKPTILNGLLKFWLLGVGKMAMELGKEGKSGTP